MTGRIRKSCGAVKSSEAGSGKGREKGKRELSSHGTAEFPCAGYAFPVSAQSPVPWHWHEEMEIIGLKSGEIKVLVPGKEFHLKAGGCIVINSNVPHSAEGKGSCAPLCFTLFWQREPGSLFSPKNILLL